MKKFVKMADGMVQELRNRFEDVQKTAEELSKMYGESADTEFQELFGYFLLFREQMLEVEQIVKKSKLEDLKRQKKEAKEALKREQKGKKGKRRGIPPAGGEKAKTKSPQRKLKKRGKVAKGPKSNATAELLSEMGDPAVYMKMLKKRGKKKKGKGKGPRAGGKNTRQSV